MATNRNNSNGVDRTGLYWLGKKTEVVRIILPFQVVETINESKADREKAQRDLFTKQARDEVRLKVKVQIKGPETGIAPYPS